MLIVGVGVCVIVLGVVFGYFGIFYIIVEKNVEFGGIWWINCYFGCGVDMLNYFYFYLFGIGNVWICYFC